MADTSLPTNETPEIVATEQPISETSTFQSQFKYSGSDSHDADDMIAEEEIEEELIIEDFTIDGICGVY